MSAGRKLTERMSGCGSPTNCSVDRGFMIPVHEVVSLGTLGIELFLIFNSAPVKSETNSRDLTLAQPWQGPRANASFKFVSLVERLLYPLLFAYGYGRCIGAGR